MTVKFSVQIERENDFFLASSDDACGGDTIIVGCGTDPYEALHDLVAELEQAEVYRPDEG